MRMHKLGTLPMFLVAVLFLGGTHARAQSYGGPAGYAAPGPMAMGPAAGPPMAITPGMVPPGYASPYGAQPAMYGGGPAPAPGYGAVDANGAPMEMSGPPEGEEAYYEDYAGEPGNIAFEVLRIVLPYAEGGLCAPRWFDVKAEAVNFKRDVSRTVNFTGLGIDAIGGVVLSTDNLSFSPEWGFRVGAAYQIAPSGSLEFGYLGSVNSSSSASVSSPTNNLYSVFSDYGTNPLFGFAETDRSYLQSIAYSSSFQSYELSWRRRWQGRNCRLQGSWLAGARYFQLTEDFEYQTRSNIPTQNAFLNYQVGTNNSLTGFQIGGDAWVTIIPGLSVGAEGKVGVYGNHAHQNTNVLATTIPNGFVETTGADDVAFLGEATFSMVYRLNYHWTFRGGYNLLVVDGVALAPENFNSGPPFVSDPTLVGRRVPFFNDNGNVFYYGWTAGFEYMW